MDQNKLLPYLFQVLCQKAQWGLSFLFISAEKMVYTTLPNQFLFKTAHFSNSA